MQFGSQFGLQIVWCVSWCSGISKASETSVEYKFWKPHLFGPFPKQLGKQLVGGLGLWSWESSRRRTIDHLKDSGFCELHPIDSIALNMNPVNPVFAWPDTFMREIWVCDCKLHFVPVACSWYRLDSNLEFLRENLNRTHRAKFGYRLIRRSSAVWYRFDVLKFSIFFQ